MSMRFSNRLNNTSCFDDRVFKTIESLKSFDVELSGINEYLLSESDGEKKKAKIQHMMETGKNITDDIIYLNRMAHEIIDDTLPGGIHLFLDGGIFYRTTSRASRALNIIKYKLRHFFTLMENHFSPVLKKIQTIKLLEESPGIVKENINSLCDVVGVKKPFEKKSLIDYFDCAKDEGFKLFILCENIFTAYLY